MATQFRKRITALDADLKVNQALIVKVLETNPAAWPEATEIGPVSASVVFIAWSHPGRMHSEAVFATLTGITPCGIREDFSAPTQARRRSTPQQCEFIRPPSSERPWP